MTSLVERLQTAVSDLAAQNATLRQERDEARERLQRALTQSDVWEDKNAADAEQWRQDIRAAERERDALRAYSERLTLMLAASQLARDEATAAHQSALEVE